MVQFGPPVSGKTCGMRAQEVEATPSPGPPRLVKTPLRFTLSPKEGEGCQWSGGGHEGRRHILKPHAVVARGAFTTRFLRPPNDQDR